MGKCTITILEVNMEHIIEIKNLVKDYGQGRGVFDVSFYVDKGEVFGFLGPNGAGKSTTIRHLMGFSTPDSGMTLINGQNSLKERDIIMQGVSYIPGEISLPSSLTGKEVLEEQMKLKGVTDRSFLDWLLNVFEVDTSLLCKEMSLGMKRKLVIVSAFMNDPDVIIMDEPSSGLDPEMQDRFVRLIKLEKKKGKTILLSSHIFQEVDACCDRIAVIKDGKIVSIFHSDELKHNSRKLYIIKYKNKERRDEVKNRLSSLGYEASDSKKGDCYLRVATDEKDTMKFIRDIDKDFIDFMEKKQTLEDYFMSFYKEDLNYGGVSE